MVEDRQRAPLPVFGLTNLGWLFYSVPSGFIDHSGYDPAGIYTPCTGCSVSKVSSLAQSYTSTWTADGSYFGDDQLGHNTINWMQVMFGNEKSNCYQGSNLCTFEHSANPFVYWDGSTEYYPDSELSQVNYLSTGYGPYETYDGLNPGANAPRFPAGGFTAPLPPTPPPPPTCNIDAYGYCAVLFRSASSGTLTCYILNRPHNFASTRTYIFKIFDAITLIGIFTHTVNYYDASPDGACPSVSDDSWDYGEPSLLLGDPNLP